MNKRTWMLVASLAIAALAVGCGGDKKGKDAAAAGKADSVAVVDVNAVQVRTGALADFNKQVNTAKQRAEDGLKPIITPMNTELAKLQAQIQDRLMAIPATQRANPDFKPDDALKTLIDKANAQNNAIKTETQARQDKLNAYINDCNTSFQTDLSPALKFVCEKYNVRVLVNKQAGIYVAPGSDLTDDVVDYLQGHPLKPFKAPPLPDEFK